MFLYIKKPIDYMIGIDLLEDRRILEFSESQKEKVFSIQELETDKLPTIFAIKEAFFKSIKRFPEWKEVEIVYEETIPKITFFKFRNIVVEDISVSHAKGMTVAVVQTSHISK
jgi:phosphopantetheinyl transferase (holo-ACP synthase)